MRVFLVCGGNMVPKVNIKQPYVYISSLRLTNPEVWDEAEKQVAKFNSKELQGGAWERLDDAIIFLQQIALKQRAGEIAFINNKIHELEKKEKLDTKQINQLKTRAQALISKINENEGFDYLEFTSLMNDVIMGRDALRGRLEVLQNNIKNANKSGKQSKGLLEDIGKELQDLIQRLNNEKQKVDRRQTTYEHIMPKIIYDYIIEHQEKLKKLTTQQLYAWAGELTLQFRQYLEKQGPFKRNLDKSSGYTTFEERKEYLESQFSSFLSASENDKLDFSDEKIEELEEIKNLLFTNTDSLEEKITRSFYNIKNPITQEESFPEVIFKFDLSDYAVSEKVGQLLFRIGDILQATGATNMADDAIIGAIKVEYSQQLDQSDTKNKIDKTLELLAQMAKEFSKVRTDREHYLDNLKTMNIRIERLLSMLDTQLKSKGTEGFIIHESDKYYKTIEHGKKGFRSASFHGRTLSILNYIDTMRSITYDFGIGNPDMWYFVGINLAKHSVAQDYVPELEYIFTMAAGLIMFDDFAVIVKEGMNKLDYSNIHNIHLYKLQSLYFPASYIIQETANYLMSLSDNNAAKAVISIPDNIYALNSYYDLQTKYANVNKKKDNEIGNKLNKYAHSSTEEQWKIVKDYMATETKVSINFFLNFQNFISQIPH